MVFKIFQPYSEMKKVNLAALQEIKCKEDGYDISKFINKPSDKYPDYILTTKENLLFWFSNDYPGFRLNFSEPAFIRKFRTPDSWDFPTHERWRLYSQKLTDNKNIEIMVGLEEKTPGRIPEISSSPEEIDRELKKEADNIAKSLKIEKEKISLPPEFSLRVDGYQVVDAVDKRVISWWLLPAFFPKEKSLPKEGLWFFPKGNEIFLSRTDYGNGLIVVSLRSVGNICWLGIGALIVFLLSFLLSYVVSPALFRKYFIFFHKNQPSISDAQKSGEGQEVEFKRGLVDDDILKSITAFANTNDGTIFIGIDDEGKINGINVKTPKEKDNFRTKIFNLIRNKIKPYLLVDIDFEEIRGYVVAKIFIPRGEELLYYLEGVIYVRDGNSDKKGQPEIVKKIVSEYV